MLEITLDSSQFEAGLDIGVLETAIFNDARSLPSPSGRWGGYAYFWPVDRGRGPVRPIFAKALRIPVGDGKFIFRKSAGPAAPREITKNSMSQLEGSAINAAIMSSGSTLRQWFVVFLNRMASFHSQVFADFTPRKSGKLASNYRPTTTG